MNKSKTLSEVLGITKEEEKVYIKKIEKRRKKEELFCLLIRCIVSAITAYITTIFIINGK